MTIFPRLFPLTAPSLRRVLGPSSPDTEVIQPEETEAVRPPAFLPGMLERATGTVEGNELSYYLQSAVETSVTHVPALRHVYRNALVRRKGFATLRSSERMGRGYALGELLRRVTKVDTLRYCYSPVIWQYFGHWLTDGIPMSFIDPDRGDLWMPPMVGSGHSLEYLDVLGLAPMADPLVFAREMIAYQDYGQGSHKRARYREINKRIVARYDIGAAEAPVFIKRGRTGVPRWIANEDALIDALVARNWKIVDIAKATVADMQKVLVRAPVVVSIEGSQLDHALLSMPEGASMVILEPQDRFLLRFLGICRARNIRPGFTVVEGSLANGYHADLDEILRTIDMTQAGG